MPSPEKKSLILEQKLCRVNKIKKHHGLLVPWEIIDYEKDFEASESTGGIFDLSFYSLIEIRGRDAEDYLQRMTTVQFKSLDDKSVVHGAFLNGRGCVVAMGMFKRKGPDCFQILILEDFKVRLLDHIEQFHFSEQFTTQDVTQDWLVLGCWSRDGKLASQLGIESGSLPLLLQRTVTSGVPIEAWKDLRRHSLFWLVIPASGATFFMNHFLKGDHLILGIRLFEYFRIQSGMPDPGEELTEKDIILEGNFNEAVARNKGCYPGQEVVERIFTYGQVNRKLQRVTLLSDCDEDISLPNIVKFGEKEVGTLVSAELNPKNSKSGVGLMYVKKEFGDSKDNWSVSPCWKVKLTF